MSLSLATFRRRPRDIPPYWVHVPLPGAEKPLPRVWLLVLEARRIPYRLSSHDGLYVPPLYARKAPAEILAYRTENRKPPPPRTYPSYTVMPWLFAALLLWSVWNGCLSGWWPGSQDFAALPWNEAGSLNVFRVLIRQEWWRCFTALTLHADSQHFVANMIFGAIFLFQFGRLAGFGPACLLTVLGGAMGNALNALYRPLYHNSLGFSTALFACVGALAAVFAVRNTGKGRVFLPLAAGVGILASLGTGDAQGRTDYAAHIFGLLSGLLLGSVYGAWLLRVPKMPNCVRFCCGCLSLGILILAWIRALLAIPA